MNIEQPPADDSHPVDKSSNPAPILKSADLLQGRKEVVIEHDGEHYRLRLTRNGRLVLYK